MSVPSEDFLYNWRNQVMSQSERGQRMVLSQVTDDLSRRGYSKREAQDALLSEGHDALLVESALNEVYDMKEVIAQEKTPRQAMLIPTSYKEVKAMVEAALGSSTPRAFMKVLAQSEQPIMPINIRAFESFTRMAECAKEDGRAMASLHAELAPYFEETMYQSVLAAQYPKNRLTVAGSKENRHVVKNAKNDANIVDVAAGTCDCLRYAQGNFALFGLACEHMVTAADAVSPHVRLVRDIVS